MELVRQFEEKARRTGRHSLIGDVQRFAEELGMKLELMDDRMAGGTDAHDSWDNRSI